MGGVIAMVKRFITIMEGVLSMMEMIATIEGALIMREIIAIMKKFI